MAILKATILSRVNKICSRTETDIDDILLEALREISMRTCRLKTTATGSTVSGQAYIAKPSDMVGTIIDGLDVGGVILKPISWSQYLNNNFAGYCVYGEGIFLRPNPSAVETYTIYYPKIHPDNLTDILFPDEYEAAIVRLTAAKLHEKYEIYDKVSNQISLYEKELSGLSFNSTPPICAYNAQEI